MGLNIAYAASMVSAYPVIGVDIHKSKVEMGKKFGLTHSIEALDMPRRDYFLEELDARGLVKSVGSAGLEKNSAQRHGKQRAQTRHSPGVGPSCTHG